MCHGHDMNSAICHAVCCGQLFHPAEKGTISEHSHLCDRGGGRATNRVSHNPCQRTWDDSKTKARATTYSDFIFLQINGHVSATKPSPQLQRNCYFNSPVPTQADASAAQGNQHPVLMDYETRVERKQLKVLKKQKPVDSIPASS